MSAEFSFHVDPARQLVRITMGGFFSKQDIQRFALAQDEAYARLTCSRNQHVTMVDIRAMQIQAQDSVAAFQMRMSNPKVAAKRIAFVVSKSLTRMQIKRATSNLNAQLFSSYGDAEAWLFEDVKTGPSTDWLRISEETHLRL